MTRVRLHSLKLQGFKSFPDQVELVFPGDVSAIIGPNGCGKSNVVDAMLWVLGEQSPSLLRLRQMGEVVFSGSAGRAPAGAAEVTLVLRSDDGHWRETDGTLEIRRRVYRSGPSEYRLNGRAVRLKDVVDELLTVGLGTRDYSIIEQGRVGQVLSARPTDRRILIEEAAGITRYKKRKHEAELKLEHTRQNLARLEDVIAEVERSRRQLKRQANQAARHQQYQDELLLNLRRLLNQEAHHLDGRRRELTRQRAQVENDVAAAAAALGSCEADLSQARAALEGGHGEVDEARSEVGALLTSRERLEAFVERSSDLIDSLRERLNHTRQESASIASSRTEIEDRCSEAASKLDELNEALAQVHDKVVDSETTETEARDQLRGAEARMEERRQDMLRTISSLTTTRNRLGETERELDRIRYTLTQLDQERARLVNRQSETSKRAEAAIADSRAATAATEELEGRRHQLLSKRAELAEGAAAATRDAEARGQELWEYRHRLVGVERDLARHTTAGTRLAEILPAATVAGQVSDYLSPSAELAPLLDRVWSDWLELPVILVDHLDSNQLEAVAELEERIRLVVATETPAASPPPPPSGAEPLLPLAGVAAEHTPWLARTLPPSYRCDSGELAQRLAAERPDSICIGPDEVVWRGRMMEPPTAGARLSGTLALRNQRQELRQEIEEAEKRTAAASDHRRRVTDELAAVEGDIRTLDAELVRAEQERARATTLEQSLLEERSRLERELTALDAELERRQTQQADLERRREKLQQEVVAIDDRNRRFEQEIEEATVSLQSQREETAECLRRLDRWRAEEQMAAERAAAASAEADRLGRERAGLDERLARSRAEIEQLAAELDRTEEEVVTSRARLVEEQGLLADARERERRMSEKVEETAARVEKLDREVRSRRDAHESVREALHAAEMELTRVDGEWERLREAAASELHTTPEALAGAELDTSDAPEALRKAIEQLRERLEKLGPVNLLALRELEELEERSVFLKEQRGDLVDALRTLDTTVREIDAVCTERFVDTMEQVNTVFHETFSRLFGGGSACLELVDPDNPLESGIDITAQPPGKKTQSVQLLSGGEKALTALSLLISLFRIKPSPFCILDEVDAPLDDANVERLADLITSMTEHTQFVMITHNRRTMARADVLYGVTMEEPGVSKTVSVRLED